MAPRYRRNLSETSGLTAQEQLRAQSFATVLNRRLMEKGWSQSDLARQVWGEKTGPDGRTAAAGRDRISSYARGLSLPSPSTLKQIADALGMTPEQLAPDLAAEIAEKEPPEMVVSTPRDRPGLMLLQINMLVPADIGAQVVALVTAARSKTG